MAFKDFRFNVAFRLIILGGTLLAFAFSVVKYGTLVSSGLLAFIAVIELLELYRYISKTNRKLQRFLESVKYSDFISGFSADNQLGQSFKDLNIAFNEVLDAFRKARSEKEEHLLYLNTIVEHVSTGLLSFDDQGDISLINATAKKLLKIDKIRNIEELLDTHTRFYKVIFDLPTGKSTLYRGDGDTQLSVHATEIVLRGIKVKLVALQNIQPELQRKELEAWQNLTRVLRHEIMNSITPIASLTSTMKDILVEDLEQKEDSQFELPLEAVDDLQDGLDTIESRSQGLIRFIDAYRDYTAIPLPAISAVEVQHLLEHVGNLLKAELRQQGVELDITTSPVDLTIPMDEELIEQILINLTKNAYEALKDHKQPKITLKAYVDLDNNPKIEVIDNGPGIIREAIDQIFVPFYSTKTTGSGIGLSLSRQIMQLHNGTLTVESELDKKTTFTLTF